MANCTKYCKVCETKMIDVIHTKLYCNDCAVSKNVRDNRLRYKKPDKALSAKKAAMKWEEESEYFRITRRKRDKSCDGSGLF